MAHPRCIVEKLPAVGDIAWLSKDEAKHAMGSRRLEAGDALELVDGRGGVALSMILPTRNAAGETGAQVSACHIQPRQTPDIHVAAAIPKGDRLATMLDMLGQLCVASFTPLDCERGVVPADRFDGARAPNFCGSHEAKPRRLDHASGQRAHTQVMRPHVPH